jgi:hypothetical protein
MNIAWYEVRDTLLGQNNKRQDVKRAWELATICQHSDANWLVELFSRDRVTTAWEASCAFRRETNDARALCFSAAMAGDQERMRRSAAMGYAFAQAWLASRTRGEESREWAQKAAAQGERDGYRQLGTKEGFWRAIELGCIESMQNYAFLFGESDPQRFFWLGQAAIRGSSFRFRNEFHEQVRLFRTDTVFAIGRALKGNVDFEANTLFGVQYGYHWALGSARVAIDFFETRLVATRSTVDAWTIVGTRLSVVKDVRRMIAELLWKAREE